MLGVLSHGNGDIVGKSSTIPQAAKQAKPSAGIPPAMRQYLEQKQRVGDAILLFRMGDFYETFYEDAKTIARVLGLTLTARDKNSESPIPLAGVPYHAVDRYVARLVRAGYKVALSEQLEDPKTAKGVVKRDVVRIITPGTLTDEGLLEEREENVLCALLPENSSWQACRVGLACVSLASGRFFAQLIDTGTILDELARLRPAEILVPETAIDEQNAPCDEIRDALGATVTPRARHAFDGHLGERALCEQFGVSSMTGFGFDRFDASLCAAAAILDYLRETQKTSLAHISRMTPRQTDDAVMIDHFTLRSLEVERTLRDGGRDGSLLGAIDLTVSPMGSRRLREWICYPLKSSTEILRRQQAITDLRSQPDRLRQVRQLVGDMGDLERIIARVGVGRASPRDMAGLARTLALCGRLPEVIGAPVRSDAASQDMLADIAKSAAGHENLAEYLSSAIKEDAPAIVREGGFIADGFNSELDRLRQMGSAGHQALAEFQAREIERTGISSLKVGYNSVFGYYIEITHQHRDKVPPDYVRRQTVRNAERYITDELKRYENDVLGAADRAVALELELFESIRARVAEQASRLQTTADAIAILDVLSGLAELSRRRDYCRPELVPEADGPLLEVVDGRHPVLDQVLGERFVPNDCQLSEKAVRLALITGPNMAGKSTYIRQAALLALLAHTGSYVPAKSMRWTPVDRIFARVGANDELARGQSTFMVEMVETARILNNATTRSLVILDEIGRGTSTYDGLAIAWAVTEYLAEHLKCLALFATHYHELTALANRLPRTGNLNVAVKEELRPSGGGRGVVFLHKILPGPTDRSYGVHVAAMAGLPGSVVTRSEQILDELEKGFDKKAGGKQLHSPSQKASDQLLLFDSAAAMPAWWRELVDAVAAVDVDRTAPLDGLAILGRLKEIVQGRNGESKSD